MLKTNSSTLTYIKQEGMDHAPTLLHVDISHEVMRDFEGACIDFFNHKDVPEDKQVKKVIHGIKDN